jgi:hypothetical protein
MDPKGSPACFTLAQKSVSHKQKFIIEEKCASAS